jgi:DNA polymerase elongation subunit (family B)
MIKQMTKKVKERKEYFIDFTDEECKEFGILENQKYTMKMHDDGSIEMTPFATMEIDIGEFDRKTLEFLIEESIEKDISVNEVITNVLEDAIKKYE